MPRATDPKPQPQGLEGLFTKVVCPECLHEAAGLAVDVVGVDARQACPRCGALIPLQDRDEAQ